MSENRRETESEWLVYRVDGPPMGPMTTSAVADAILTGRLPPDVWIAAPSAMRWLRAIDVPVIASRAFAEPTRRPRESGMQRVPVPPGAGIPPLKPPPAPPRKLDATVKSAGTPAEPPSVGSPPTPVTVDSKDALFGPVTDRDSEPAPTIRSTNPRGPDGFPIPAPTPTPTPTPTPPRPIYRGGETLESPGQDRGREEGEGGGSGEVPRKKMLAS